MCTPTHTQAALMELLNLFLCVWASKQVSPLVPHLRSEAPEAPQRDLKGLDLRRPGFLDPEAPSTSHLTEVHDLC